MLALNDSGEIIGLYKNNVPNYKVSRILNLIEQQFLALLKDI